MPRQIARKNKPGTSQLFQSEQAQFISRSNWHYRSVRQTSATLLYGLLSSLVATALPTDLTAEASGFKFGFDKSGVQHRSRYVQTYTGGVVYAAQEGLPHFNVFFEVLDGIKCSDQKKGQLWLRGWSTVLVDLVLLIAGFRR